MIELELGSSGAEEMSVFQRLLLEKGTNPFRLGVCPADITLHARLLPPVPPPLPPEPPEPPDPPLFVVGFETPEQAIRLAKKASRITGRMHLAAEQGQRMVRLLSRTRRGELKRPMGHVPIRTPNSD